MGLTHLGSKASKYVNDKESWNIIRFSRNKALKTFQLWSNSSAKIHMTVHSTKSYMDIDKNSIIQSV